MKSEKIQVGGTFSGFRGHYTITKVSPDAASYGLHQGKGTLTVKYLDGDWKNKTVDMRVQTHLTIQHNQEIGHQIAVKLNRANNEEILDQWFYKYPKTYNSNWHKGISSEELSSILIEKYPNQWIKLFEEDLT